MIFIFFHFYIEFLLFPRLHAFIFPLILLYTFHFSFPFSQKKNIIVYNNKLQFILSIIFEVIKNIYGIAGRKWVYAPVTEQGRLPDRSGTAARAQPQHPHAPQHRQPQAPHRPPCNRLKDRPHHSRIQTTQRRHSESTGTHKVTPYSPQ